MPQQQLLKQVSIPLLIEDKIQPVTPTYPPDVSASTLYSLNLPLLLAFPLFHGCASSGSDLLFPLSFPFFFPGFVAKLLNVSPLQISFLRDDWGACRKQVGIS